MTTEEIYAGCDRILAECREGIELAEKQNLKYHDEIDADDKEAEKCKSEGDMYGWNFHKGKESGLINAGIIFSYAKTLCPAACQSNVTTIEGLRIIYADSVDDLWQKGVAKDALETIITNWPPRRP